MDPGGSRASVALALYKMEQPLAALDAVRRTLYLGEELLDGPDEYAILEREMAALTSRIMKLRVPTGVCSPPWLCVLLPPEFGVGMSLPRSGTRSVPSPWSVAHGFPSIAGEGRRLTHRKHLFCSSRTWMPPSGPVPQNTTTV